MSSCVIYLSSTSRHLRWICVQGVFYVHPVGPHLPGELGSDVSLLDDGGLPGGMIGLGPFWSADQRPKALRTRVLPSAISSLVRVLE